MPKLKPDLYEFGRRLLETNDLDPVYVLLWGAGLPPARLRRWLLAYWCFYHVGTASWVTDAKAEFYWHRMKLAADSKDYPRQSERRHFRGDNARKSVAWLEAQGIDRLFEPFWGGEMGLKSVMKHVQTWLGFGPWIAFKVADMLERLAICPVRFDAAEVFLFDSPKEGANLAWKRYGEEDRPESVGEWAVESILSRLGDRLAPPRYDRTINSQEAETVLCKWKSALNGGYRIGEDIEAARKGLEFRPGNTAARLSEGGKVGGLW